VSPPCKIFRGADPVIEAFVLNKDVKKKLFVELDRITKPLRPTQHQLHLYNPLGFGYDLYRIFN
jgi:hypothetical protein